MTTSPRRVGRITVAVTLVAFGLALLLDNLGVYSGSAAFIAKFWPVMLIGFGLEYLIFSLLPSESERRLRLDWGGAFLLAIIVAVSLSVSAFHSFIWDGGAQINIPIGPSETTSEVKTASSAGAKELVIDVGIGAVSLHPAATGGEIRVEATYTTHGISIDRGEVRNQLSDIHLNITEGETVTITSDLPQALNNPSIEYTVYAPNGLTVKAQTGAGRIEVTGYKGDLQLTSNVGRIDVTASTGSLRANSGSGSITVLDFEGPINAHSNVGSLTIRNAVGGLQLGSGIGSISVQEYSGGQLIAETRTGRVDVSTGAVLEGNVSLKTSTGSVSLSAPKESSIRATAQTRTGSINVPSFMTVTRQGTSNSAVGTSGDGTYTVSLEASTGSVNFHTR